MSTASGALLKPFMHPGDMLREDFMKPLGLSAYAVAKAIGATLIAISEITRRKRAISPEMALKLGRLFNVSPELRMGVRIKKVDTVPPLWYSVLESNGQNCVFRPGIHLQSRLSPEDF